MIPSKNLLLNQKILLPVLIGWLLPIAMAVMSFVIVMDPDQTIDAFQKDTFIPAVVEVLDDTAISRKGKETDHFELWIVGPNEAEYFLRDPNPEPIQAFYDAIPKNEVLEIHFWKTVDGNKIVNLAVPSSGELIVSLDQVLAAERKKRTVILLAAVGMFLLGNALLYWNYRNLKLEAEQSV